MPLMIYVGGNIDVRRSKAAFKRRAVNAAKRGWTQARIKAFREGVEGGGAGSSGKGGGAGSSGKGWRQSNAWNTSCSSGNAW